jgi:hypothetical protein
VPGDGGPGPGNRGESPDLASSGLSRGSPLSGLRLRLRAFPFRIPGCSVSRIPEFRAPGARRFAAGPSPSPSPSPSPRPRPPLPLPLPPGTSASDCWPWPCRGGASRRPVLVFRCVQSLRSVCHVPQCIKYQGAFAKKKIGPADRLPGGGAPPVLQGPGFLSAERGSGRKGCLARAIGPSGAPWGHPPSRPRAVPKAM